MPKPGQGGSGVGLTLVHGQQRREAALVPDGDEQRPGKHDEDNGKDVPSLRHLQGWLHPQLLITWAMARSGWGVATEHQQHKGEKNRHWAGRPGTRRQKPNTGQQLSPALTPTHCGSKFAESSLMGVCEGAVVQGRVRNLQRLIPVRRSSRK